ncbi:MAG: protein BatD, partial [Bacteroidales bacterium]|nr:protein BatD [Bacteroidales bacterium]
MKKTVLSILALLFTAAAALAQGSIRVEVHNIVELSERFNVVFVVEGEHAPSDFSWEAPADFTVVWGPQKGSSSSISIVNGKTTRSSQTSYTYILQAKAAGTFTLGAANATVKGKTISSKPVQIQVLSSSQGASAGSAGASQGQAGAEASAPAEPLFLKLSLSRNEVVVGEPVTVTLKIYHRTNLVGFENAKFPSFNGFWSQEVETPQNIEFQREQLGGTMYNSAVLRRWVIIPQKAGSQIIEAAQIVCLVNEKRRRGGGSFFDDFFENDYITTRQQAVSQAPVLRVSPLPSGAPAGFGGGVGQFSLQARVSRDTLKAHDAASLLITISGKGNIALVDAPKISFPPDFEVYDVKTSVNTDKSGTSGSKTFEYPFIPRSHGDFVLNPVKFSWYDVKQRQYKTAASDSLRLRVLKNGNATAAEPASPGLIVERKGVENLSEDIRFIHTDTRLHSPRALLIARPAYWIAVLAEVLAALALAIGLRRRAARRSDVAGTRKRKATR